jgi:formylmethanofuran dehydrogenase subunit E
MSKPEPEQQEQPEPALVCALCGKPVHESARVDDGRLICDDCLRANRQT